MPLFVDHVGMNTLISQDLDTENNILSIHDRQIGSRCIEYAGENKVYLLSPLSLEQSEDPENPTVRTTPVSFSFWINLIGENSPVPDYPNTPRGIFLLSGIDYKGVCSCYFEEDELKFAAGDYVFPSSGPRDSSHKYASKIWSFSFGTFDDWKEMFVNKWNHVWIGWSSDFNDNPVLYVNSVQIGSPSNITYSDTLSLTPNPTNMHEPTGLFLMSKIWDFEIHDSDFTLCPLGGKLQSFGFWGSNNESDVEVLYNNGKVNLFNLPSQNDIIDFWELGGEENLKEFDIGQQSTSTTITSLYGEKSEMLFLQLEVLPTFIIEPPFIGEGAPLDARSNSFLGDVTGEKRLAGLNTHRNGPYGFSTWNQLRASENPLTRYHRKVNTLTFVTDPGIQRNVGGSENFIVRDRYSRLYRYTEPCITERHYPIIWNVGNHFRNSRNTIATEPRKFSMFSSFGNQLESFSNEKINKLLNYSTDEKQLDYSEITKLYLDGGLDSQDSPITYWEFLQYRESIYPKQINQYRIEVRNRPQFYSFFPHSRNDRTKLMTTSSLGFSPSTDFDEFLKFRKSIWPLDEDEFFLTRYYEDVVTEQYEVSGGINFNFPDGSDLPEIEEFERYFFDGRRVAPNYAGRYGEGFLMNTTSQFHENLGVYSSYFSSNTLDDTYESYLNRLNKSMHYGPFFTRRPSLRSIQSVSSPSGMIIPETGSSTNANMPIFQGGALWEAGSTRQVKTRRNTYVTSEKKPFYNTYSDYVQEIRNKGKNYSVVPEFRMSIQFEDLLDAPDLFEQDIFEITGGISGSEDSSKNSFYETYSNSEFMKNFEIIKRDHEDFTSATILSLRCKAIKKFLPYDGFYPAQRTAQLAEKFINDTKDFISTNNDSGFSYDTINLAKQSAYMPLFAPGIMFNTIKSGIAVDFPILTSSLSVEKTNTQGSVDNYFIKNDRFDVRVPFEAIIDPKSYVKNIAIQCMEPSVYGNLSSSAQWTGDGSEIYSYMANNFMAEVPSFFLEGANMSSLVSKKQSAIGVLEKGKVYGMRIKMRRSMSGKRNQVYKDGSESTPYLTPQDIIKTGSNASRETFTMYSRPSAFGPPSLGSTTFDNSDVLIFDEDRYLFDTRTLVQDSFNGYNYPFTPPYYHGEAWCDIIITGSGNQLTLASLQASASYTYTRYDYTHVVSTGHTIQTTIGPQSIDKINDNAMQLNSSVIVDGLGRVAKRGNAGGSFEGQIIVDSGVNEDSRWIIQPKFETPMLNFNHISEAGGTLSVPVYGSESVPRGMWHQYGRIPEIQEGVFLEVGPIPRSWETQVMERGPVDPLRDLSSFLGFNGASTKLGKVAKQKVISEAVVAVPFIKDEGRRKFFRLDKEKVRKFKEGQMQLLTTGPASSQIGKSVLHQLEMMRKFIFPPSMDFLNFDTVEPFAMYVFEFEHTLSQQDLVDIWQNLPPDIGETIEMAEVAITHPLLQKELLGTGNGNATIELPDRLQWMVFKVKQRASSNYYKKVVKSNVDVNSTVNSATSDSDEFGSTSPLQFNWPYDYFSLIEMVKIDAEVEIGNADLSNYTDNLPSWNAVQASSAIVQDILAPRESVINEVATVILPEIDLSSIVEGELSPLTVDEEVVRSTEVFAGQDVERGRVRAGSSVSSGVSYRAEVDLDSQEEQQNQQSYEPSYEEESNSIKIQAQAVWLRKYREEEPRLLVSKEGAAELADTAVNEIYWNNPFYITNASSWQNGFRRIVGL